MLRIRLRRTGAKKKPTYRVVVADARSPRDGAFLDILGHYNPRTEPSTVVIDAVKAQRWLANGAQPSDRVARLLKREGIERGGAGAVATAEAPAAATAPTPEEATPARSRARRSADAGAAGEESPVASTASAAEVPATAEPAEDGAPAKRPTRRRATAESAQSAATAEGTPPLDSAAAKEEA
jgi:small subunit ribosomal protein S16